MAVGPLSRYRGLDVLQVSHPARGVTRSLPIRRLPQPPAAELLRHRFTASDTADLLALQYFGREDLDWLLLDANGGRAADGFVPGETLSIPDPATATQVRRGLT